MPRLTCPACSSLLRWDQIALDTTFGCPACRKGLHVSHSYSKVLLVSSLLAAATISYLLGIRGFYWIVATTALDLPVNFVLMAFAMKRVPPRLVLSDTRSFNLNGPS
jgi:hypothetical protein